MAINLKDLGVSKSTYGDGFSDTYAVLATKKQYEDGLPILSENISTQKGVIDEAMIGARRQNQGLLNIVQDQPQQNTDRARLRKRRQSAQRHGYQRNQINR